MSTCRGCRRFWKQRHLDLLGLVCLWYDQGIVLVLVDTFPLQDFLDTLAGTFETDLTSDQMSDLIQVALNSMNDWDIKSYSAWGGSGKGKVASMGSQEVYFIFPNSRSVDFTKELFHTILNNELITDEQLSNAPGAY